MDLIDAKFPQPFDNKGRCVMTVEPKLWMGVQVATPSGHIIRKFGDAVQDGHC
jgi:hypothetical protein